MTNTNINANDNINSNANTNTNININNKSNSLNSRSKSSTQTIKSPRFSVKSPLLNTYFCETISPVFYFFLSLLTLEGGIVISFFISLILKQDALFTTQFLCSLIKAVYISLCSYLLIDCFHFAGGLNYSFVRSQEQE